MIIAFRSHFSLVQILFWLRIAVWVAVGVVVLFFSVALLRTEVWNMQGAQLDERALALGEMLTGPLALQENSRSPLAVALEQKLVFLAQSIRPDVKQEERVFRIGVKGSDEGQVVREGEPIRCQLVEHESGGVDDVAFSAEGGNCVMIPHVLDGRSLLLKVEKEAGEAMELVLKASSDVRASANNVPEVAALQSAKWWGIDLFFREYGGSDFRPLSGRQKIEVVCGKLRSVLLVKEGDFLVFDEGRWKVIGGLEEAMREAPLAQVKGVSQGGIEVEAWDVDGFLLFDAMLELERASVVRFVADQVVQGAKLRTAKQVSCKIGKKRFVLQSDDWLLKTQLGWHKLRGAEEIEGVLSHELRGELCVIDGIDARGTVTGKFFNEMRTQMVPFSFQAVSSKGNRKEMKK